MGVLRAHFARPSVAHHQIGESTANINAECNHISNKTCPAEPFLQGRERLMSVYSSGLFFPGKQPRHSANIPLFGYSDISTN